MNNARKSPDKGENTQLANEPDVPVPRPDPFLGSQMETLESALTFHPTRGQ